MDNHHPQRTHGSAPMPTPSVGHVLAAFDALRISQVPVWDLIRELERRGFDMPASIRAFDLTVMDGLLYWTTGSKLIKLQP